MIVKPEMFILDVDGVMTDGSFFYSAEGKVLKRFGPDDGDALTLLKPFLEIVFITGDKRGFEISRKRIEEDMGYPIHLVSTVKRLRWIRERKDPKRVIFMGDGIFDFLVMREVGYGIATSDSDANARRFANFVTQRRGGERAVSEACIHILQTFFEPFDPETWSPKDSEIAGDWNK